MSLTEIAEVSQIVGAIAVVVSLIYVAFQLRQTQAALVRAEANATQDQFSAIRLAIVSDPDVARLWRLALEGEASGEAVDELRVEYLIAEQMWASFHVWDRARRGLSASGDWTKTGARQLVRMLSTERGRTWWSRAKRGLAPAFVADLDSMLASVDDA
ncbi:MAG: hypothetical protein U1E50_09955 [Caulobacteraceae bacterium]